MPADDKLDQRPDLISRDDQFLCRLNEVIEANIGDELFGVSDLAGAMALSRVHLYRKIHRLTGKNISQFIRERRLQYARELLLKDVATVAEIAYRAGFTSPAYFSKCFHEYYGYPPGEVKKRNGPADREIPSLEEPPAFPG
ncbi:MAG: helix-turn-helix transcriptional regulator, partial [Cyclobacteriaceae bacterium]|nr:helix-turn-helix transcriptional regulator [Cyclobacteriaceae bacterium]